MTVQDAMTVQDQNPFNKISVQTALVMFRITMLILTTAALQPTNETGAEAACGLCPVRRRKAKSQILMDSSIICIFSDKYKNTVQ
jgi:sucrose-6-phosphate hydrolase SacC (GH32 family)